MDNQKISIVIVDDNVLFSQELKWSLMSDTSLEVIATINNGLEACQAVVDLKPDVVILDGVMPYIDGMEVLDQLRNALADEMPTCIMLTSLSQESVIKMSANKGAHYFMTKPFEVEVLKNRIKILTKNHSTTTSYSIPVKHKTLETIVAEYLRYLEIPAHLQGHNVLRHSILLALRDDDCLKFITKELYPNLAKTLRIRPSNIERSIRTAVQVTWKQGLLADKVPGLPPDRIPTNSRFIATVADVLRMRSDVSEALDREKVILDKTTADLPRPTIV